MTYTLKDGGGDHHLREAGWEGVDWIHLALGSRDLWRALVSLPRRDLFHSMFRVLCLFYITSVVRENPGPGSCVTIWFLR
jgi:hypothetical protein